MDQFSGLICNIEQWNIWWPHLTHASSSFWSNSASLQHTLFCRSSLDCRHSLFVIINHQEVATPSSKRAFLMLHHVIHNVFFQTLRLFRTPLPLSSLQHRLDERIAQKKKTRINSKPDCGLSQSKVGVQTDACTPLYSLSGPSPKWLKMQM